MRATVCNHATSAFRFTIVALFLAHHVMSMIYFLKFCRRCTSRCEGYKCIRSGSIFENHRNIPLKIFLRMMYFWANNIPLKHAGKSSLTLGHGMKIVIIPHFHSKWLNYTSVPTPCPVTTYLLLLARELFPKLWPKCWLCICVANLICSRARFVVRAIQTIRPCSRHITLV